MVTLLFTSIGEASIWLFNLDLGFFFFLRTFLCCKKNTVRSGDEPIRRGCRAHGEGRRSRRLKPLSLNMSAPPFAWLKRFSYKAAGILKDCNVVHVTALHDVCILNGKTPMRAQFVFLPVALGKESQWELDMFKSMRKRMARKSTIIGEVEAKHESQ